MRQLHSSNTLPWLCMGDFNQILKASKKQGGKDPLVSLMASFKEVIFDCNLIKLPMYGSRFTRERSMGTNHWIQEKTKQGLYLSNLVTTLPSSMGF